MKSNFEIRIVRDEFTQHIPVRCTLRQGYNAVIALSYAGVEQDISSVELWLVTRSLEKRVTHCVTRRGNNG